MSSISLENVGKVFDKGSVSSTAVDGVNLQIEQGELVVFVGPSGCGKSTMLRMIAGLESVSTGNIRFDGKVVNHLSPSERGVGMVFQSYALYPHKTVAENISFPLKMARKGKQEIKASVTEVAEMLEISHLLDTKPSQLSGGQRQRVAIGRALVRQPAVFLLDEPLSNLDAALRSRMRLSLAEYHRSLGCTMVYVTHDQTEAMTLADKVVVLKEGRVEQCGTPQELYETPDTAFVAEFIGTPRMNMIPARYEGEENGLAHLSIGTGKFTAAVDTSQKIEIKAGAEVTVGVRPENMQICHADGLSGQVVQYEYMGSEALAYIKIDQCKEPMLLRCDPSHRLAEGQLLSFTFDEFACLVFDANGQSIRRRFRKKDA